jgi:signal transduction histidine kinase
VLLALSALTRAFYGAIDTPGLVGAGVLTALAACVTLANAAIDMRETLTAEGSELMAASAALIGAERLLQVEEARQQELAHDARTVIAAVSAASSTLDQHADQLDAGTRQHLRLAMQKELDRLGRLLDSPSQGPLRPFDVAEALDPVLVTLRAQGLDLRSRVDSARAQGRRDDLAEVVHTLLVNARRHAPGSPVSVQSEEADGTVLIRVGDRGPGIPASLLPQLFDRGVSGCQGGGEGLGLHVARRLMRAQGGDLEVVSRPGGGAEFLVSLPSAPSPDSTSALTTNAVGSCLAQVGEGTR